MIILIGMTLCILYCIIKFIIGLGTKTSLIVFSIIIFFVFAIIGSDAGHIFLGMFLGIVFALFGILCALEGERRSSKENIEFTKREIYNQDRYDDDLGFNDFNK